MSIPNTIALNYKAVEAKLGANAVLVAVSKTKPLESLMAAYEGGARLFGENKVQEIALKQPQMPSDAKFHMLGHLQTNKVKALLPHVSLIHSVDSLKLLTAINTEGEKLDLVTNCLLQCYIAEEDTKYGLDASDLEALLHSEVLKSMHHIKIVGLMGMATFTDNSAQIKTEFGHLRQMFDTYKADATLPPNVQLTELSMGMSSDYEIALAEGSTMIRVGSAIFGNR